MNFSFKTFHALKGHYFVWQGIPNINAPQCKRSLTAIQIEPNVGNLVPMASRETTIFQLKQITWIYGTTIEDLPAFNNISP